MNKLKKHLKKKKCIGLVEYEDRIEYIKGYKFGFGFYGELGFYFPKRYKVLYCIEEEVIKENEEFNSNGLYAIAKELKKCLGGKK